MDSMTNQKLEGHEQAKKLYRYIREHVKSLDESRARSRTVLDLFEPAVVAQRARLRDRCERLIFAAGAPGGGGRRAEELLWRKGFYEPVVAAKQLRAASGGGAGSFAAEERAAVGAHLDAGVGYYHHHVMRVHREYGLAVAGHVDFVAGAPGAREAAAAGDAAEWAELSVHRSLVYLGDLCRYKLDLYPDRGRDLVSRYYTQAILYKPEFGMPYNQLGTLANNSNNSLEAAYYYLRSLTCRNTFEGTENNLIRLFDKNATVLNQFPTESPDSDVIVQLEPSDQVRRFIARFLNLIDIWWFDKKLNRIFDLCHQTNVDFQECMGYLKNDFDKNYVFKIVSICLLCVSKLKPTGSECNSTVAFSLAVYSQLVTSVINYIQEGVLNFPIPPSDSDLKKWINKSTKKRQNKRKKKIKRRRRKPVVGSDTDLEESSDDNLSVNSNSESEDENNGSDLENNSSDSSENENENEEETSKEVPVDDKSDKSSTDTVEDFQKKSKLLDPNDFLSIISDTAILPSIKIFDDYLKSDLEILKSCAKSTRSLLHQIVNLSNLLNVDFENEKVKKDVDRFDFLKENRKVLALPEDVMLKGVEILAKSQVDIDWKLSAKSGLTVKEQNLLRIYKILDFGHFLTKISGTGMSFDRVTNTFSVKIDETYTNGVEENVSREIESKTAEPNGQLTKMKHMGQLWLTAEVKDLENRVKGKSALSPFLVVDADSLILHTSMVKQLVFSRKFIVLVPTAVVSVLDDMKSEKPEARDAIRWLESQFHQGNRFFRAQRPQERAPIPYVKYPKRRDRDLQVFIQMVECCHYLARQQKGASNLVTLLVGTTNFAPTNSSDTTSNSNTNTNSNKDKPSYVGLARSAGVNLESISEFYSRWKKGTATPTAKGKR